MKNRGCQLDANDVAKIKLSKFNEMIVQQHMMKVLFGSGLYAAFRGSAEHTFFTRSQIKFGTYPQNFENSKLAGCKWIAIDNIPRDKTAKITVNNSYARDMCNLMRFPIVENDPDNFGASLARLVNKMSPGQERVYCKPASASYKMSLAERGHPDAEFYPTVVLGEKSIATLFRKGASILGLAEDFKPHSLRSACITMLANDSSVSIAETMRVARHTSVSASKVYQRVDGISESNRLNALGQLKSAEDQQACLQEEKKEDDDSIEMVHCRSYDVDTGSLNGTEVDENSVDGDVVMGDDDEEDYNALVEEYAQLKDELTGMMRIRGGGGGGPSLTQVGIDELKGDILELKGQLKAAKAYSKKPAKSENQLEIEKLKSVVRSLKQRLEDQELYADSLEHDNDVRVMELEQELKNERKLRKKLQRENQEFQRFLLRDKKRAEDLDDF